MRHLALLAATSLLEACACTSAPPLGEDGARVEQVVQRAAPVGSLASQARGFLEQRGFACTTRMRAPLAVRGLPDPRIDGRPGLFDYLDCTQGHGESWMVTRECEVAILLHDDQVVEVLAKVWLDGP